MSIQYKKFLYNGLVGGIIASYIFFKVATVNAASLDPGVPVTMCGEMDEPGIYVIAEDFNVPSGNCFIVQADNVTILGTTTTPTITGSSGYSFVTVATDILTGNTYGTTTIQNLNVSGFTNLVYANSTYYGGSASPIYVTDVNTSGAIHSSGGYGYPSGGNGASITITNSTMGNVLVFGGSSPGGTGGNGGNVSVYNNSTVGNISAFGGEGSYAGNGGTINVSDSTVGNIATYATGTWILQVEVAGNGGAVTLTNSTAGIIDAHGGNLSRGYSQYSNYSGDGGAVTLINSTTTGNIIANGGYASVYYGAGGVGGTVTLTNSTTAGNIYSNGGQGGRSGGGDAGNGGSVSLNSSTVSGSITANGGYGYQGSGGNGGNITLTDSTSGSISTTGGDAQGDYTAGNSGSISITNSQTGALNSIGGSVNSYGYYNTAGSSGSITVSGASAVGDITSTGGDGYYGNAGSITVSSGSTAGNITSTGGYGYHSGYAGTITISSSSVLSISTSGGDGIGYLGKGADINITNSTISSGNVSSTGGGIFGNHGGGAGGQISVTDSTVSGSISSTAGSAYFGANENAGDIYITNSNIGQSVSSNGGLLWFGSSSWNSSYYISGDAGSVTIASSTVAVGVSSVGGYSLHSLVGGGSAGSVTITGGSDVGSVVATGGDAPNSYAGDGGTVTLTNSTSGDIRASGGNGNYGGNGGTVTLQDSSVSENIWTYGGWSNFGNGGNGGTVTLQDSSVSENIYTQGGYSYAGYAGNGGNVTLTNSVSGNIFAYGGLGSPYSTVGTGAIIDISGTDMKMFASNPILDVFGDNPGTITVNGSILFEEGENWTQDATSWLGTVTWSFLNDSQNQGVVKGGTDFRDTSVNATGAYVIGTCQLFDDSVNNGTCDTVVYKQGYYFKPVNSEDWEDELNWFVDKDATIALGFAPVSTDETIYITGTTTGPVASTTVGTIKVADDKTGGGTFGIDISNIFGLNPSNFSVSFFNGGFNTGIINGLVKIFSSLGLSSVNQGGVVNGDVEFYNDSYNDINNVSTGVFSGIAKFFNTSYNAINGVLGTAQFNASSQNRGTVTTGTFNNSSSNTSTGNVTNATFNHNSVNLGTFTTALFNGSSYNAGTATGNATFNPGTKNTGTVLGNVTFKTNTRNEGTIGQTATFEGNAYNIGTSTNATFVGEYSENFNGGNQGSVTNIKTRLYNAANQQYNLLRNFAESAWTIVADNTFVKLLYRTLIDLLPGSSTETTLVQQNGGFILAPTLGTAITGCTVLDTPDTTYVLQNNITNFKYDTCFIVMADNITLDGNNKIIDALASATTTAIVTASTTVATTGASAYTGFTLKNATLTDFDIAIDARGRSNTNGTGGQGSTLSFESVILGADILADGGDGTLDGGSAGHVSLLDTSTKSTTSSTTISMNGGSSTSCGVGGNGGSLDSINSEFDLVSAIAGSLQTSGCVTSEQETAVTNNSGSITSGGVRTNEGTYTPPSSGGTGGETGGGTGGDTRGTGGTTSTGGTSVSGTTLNIINNPIIPLIFTPLNPFNPINPNFNPTNIGATITPEIFKNFNIPGAINFIQIPINFFTNISKFLFAPLPDNFNEALSSSGKLGAYLASVGISREQDIASLQVNPERLEAPLSDETTPAGLFIIKSGEATLTSYATYEKSLGGLVQLVKVSPDQSLTISLIPQSTGQVTALYLGQNIIFTQGSLFASVSIQTPSQGGRYVLKTSSSPLPLLIEVISPESLQTTKKPWGIFHFIWKWFN